MSPKDSFAPRPPQLSLIVPVYNGAARLPAVLDQLREFVRTRPYSWELIFVDDHSDDAVARALDAFAEEAPCVSVLHNERNMGKGYSVARGMRAARGAFRVFTDQDLAYPTTEIDKIFFALLGGADVAVACRVLPESRYLMSPTFFSYLYTRHVMSRLFNALVRWTLIPRVRDTQAGLKGFTAAAADIVFPRLTIDRFGFDVEALFIARKYALAIQQVAVNFRYDDEPTTVRFVKDAADMARDLFRIRTNEWRRRYD
ncbi:MAG TPA: glycosyltransferase [Gemmatimonadaceae bacterium]|nr:glycosyltransferase [Gemmatimonadaceae bacterium]